MNNRRHFLPLLAAFFLCVPAAQAQELRMSLDELLSQADSGNSTLQAARNGIEAAREAAAATDRSAWLPDVRLEASLGYLGDGYGWGRDSSYSFTVEMPHMSTRFGIEAQQVIYAGGATSAARRQAALGVRMEQLGFEQRRQDVRLQLAGHYLDLYRSMRQLEVYDSNIALAERMIADIRARHEQGTALKNDLTRYELQLATLQMQRSVVENDLEITNSTIVSLAGLKEGTRVVPTNVEPPDAPLEEGMPIALQMADTKSTMADEQMRQTRAALLPYVAFVAQNQLNGPVTIDITPYDINYNYWFVGIALNYNLSSLWKSNRGVRAARLRQEQARTERQAADEQTRLAVKAAQIRLDEAIKNHRIKQKSLDLATENYALVADRYQNDLALLVDMLDASNQKLAAELDLIGAKLTVAYRQYTLQYINGKL